ncbi:ABC transporter permease [Nocardia sp. NPDC058633]|uniref:ABC transporter permease n=1 Tax=Nocardia sp. NPDC058633 TaxID=3346568 RepID=UPI00364E49D5
MGTVVVAADVDPLMGRSRFRGRGLRAMVGWRLVTLLPVLVAVSAALFAAAAVSPFDPLVGYLGARYETTSVSDRTMLTRQLGLDASWYQLYGRWIGDLLGGDLGVSRGFGQPVSTILAQRIPWTMLLVAVAMGIAIAVALGAGVWAGMHRGGPVDRLVTGSCVIMQGLPPFVVSLAAIALFAVGLGWLPAAGLTDAGAEVGVGQVARHLVLPAAALAVSQVPWLLLAVRESVSGNRGEDFVVGAVTRGIDSATITRGHILPTSLAPFVTILGARLPEVVVGAVLVEEIFSWPGIAGAFVRSAQDLDMALLAVLTVGTTCAVMLGSLLADVAVVLLDPRVRADG